MTCVNIPYGYLHIHFVKRLIFSFNHYSKILYSMDQQFLLRDYQRVAYMTASIEFYSPLPPQELWEVHLDVYASKSEWQKFIMIVIISHIKFIYKFIANLLIFSLIRLFFKQIINHTCDNISVQANNFKEICFFFFFF